MSKNDKHAIPELPNDMVCVMPDRKETTRWDAWASLVRYRALRAARPELSSDYEGLPFVWLPLGENPYRDLAYGGESLCTAAADYGEKLWEYGRALDLGDYQEGHGDEKGKNLSSYAYAFYREHRREGNPGLSPALEAFEHEGLGNDAALAAFTKALRRAQEGAREEAADAEDKAEDALARRIADFVRRHRPLLRSSSEKVSLWPAASFGLSNLLQCSLSVSLDDLLEECGRETSLEAHLAAFLQAYDSFVQEHRAYLALMRSVQGACERAALRQANPLEDQDDCFYAEYPRYHAMWEHAMAWCGGGVREDEETDAIGELYAKRYELARFELRRLAELLDQLDHYEAEHPGVAETYYGTFGDPEWCLGCIYGAVCCRACCKDIAWDEPEEEQKPEEEQEPEEERACEQERSPEQDQAAREATWLVDLLNSTYKADRTLRLILNHEEELESEFQQVDVETPYGTWQRISLAAARAKRLKAWWNLGNFALSHPEAASRPLFAAGEYRDRLNRAIAFAQHQEPNVTDGMRIRSVAVIDEW